MVDVEVIEDPAAASAALEPIKARLLSELGEPASAAGLASRIGLPRQKVHYHLKALEGHGLVREAGVRQWGGLTERLFVATAASYLASPSAFGPIAADPSRTADRQSASYLVALGARIVREVADLWRRATQADKHLATLAVDAEVHFRSPAERARFTQELTGAVTALVARYHDASAPGSRPHRLIVVAHPIPVEGSRSEHARDEA